MLAEEPIPEGYLPFLPENVRIISSHRGAEGYPTGSRPPVYVEKGHKTAALHFWFSWVPFIAVLRDTSRH